jgi:hypothetical protein
MQFLGWFITVMPFGTTSLKVTRFVSAGTNMTIYCYLFRYINCDADAVDLEYEDSTQRAGDLCSHVDFATLDICAPDEGNVRTPDKRHQPNVMLRHYAVSSRNMERRHRY